MDSPLLLLVGAGSFLLTAKKLASNKRASSQSTSSVAPSPASNTPNIPNTPIAPIPLPTSGAPFIEQIPGYYGTFWENRRPYGLPQTPRNIGSSRSMGAIPLIRWATQNDDKYFREYALVLAEKESGATLARAANIFDLRPSEQRPTLDSGDKKPYVSAWGCYQFNRDAWRGLRNKPSYLPEYKLGIGSKIKDTDFPWDCSQEEEITQPLNRYRQIYYGCVNRGFGPLEALWITASAHAGNYAGILMSHGPNTVEQTTASMSDFVHRTCKSRALMAINRAEGNA